MRLHTIKPAKGSTKKRKRVGRGTGSGHGGTSCKGHKGQKARSKGKGPHFEGGQTPLVRKSPKLGKFKLINRMDYAIVNVEKLNLFLNGEEITPEILVKFKIIKDIKDGVKILGKGVCEKKLTVRANQFSQKAKEKIESVGGKAICF